MLEPCKCGSAVFWYRKDTYECAGCHPEPFNPFAVKAVIVEIKGKRSFEKLDIMKERQYEKAWA